MTRLLLAALAAQVDGVPADGGMSAIYASCPAAQPAIQLDGGWFLPTPRGERLACELAACEAVAIPVLTQQPVPEPTGAMVAILSVVAILSAVAGYLAPHPK